MRGGALSYVEPHEQLIVEVYVRSLVASQQFYEQLGFRVLRAEPHFAELAWDDCLLFLEEVPGQPPPPDTLVCNLRIMVPDVDHYWTLVQPWNLRVVHPIGDRYYGLRDFTVVSPDGIGLRFATILPAQTG